MFIPVSDEPVAFVLAHDRDNPVRTFWYIQPMTAEQSTAYRTRWKTEEQRYNLPAATRAAAQIRVDRETAQEVIVRAENVFAEGDSLEGEELKLVIATKLDFTTLQELLMAAQSGATLEAGSKK